MLVLSDPCFYSFWTNPPPHLFFNWTSTKRSNSTSMRHEHRPICTGTLQDHCWNMIFSVYSTVNAATAIPARLYLVIKGGCYYTWGLGRDGPCRIVVIPWWVSLLCVCVCVWICIKTLLVDPPAVRTVTATCQTSVRVTLVNWRMLYCRYFLSQVIKGPKQSFWFPCNVAFWVTKRSPTIFSSLRNNIFFSLMSNYQEVRNDWASGRGAHFDRRSQEPPMSSNMDAVLVRLSQANLLKHKGTQTTLKLHATSCHLSNHGFTNDFFILFGYCNCQCRQCWLYNLVS